MENQKYSNARLILRTLTPSSSSIVGSLAVMVVIISFHMLLLSNQPELFLPHVAGDYSDQLTNIYETNVIGPLNALFGNSLLGVLSTVLLWGFVGWIVYSLLDLAIMSFQEWRKSDEDIAYTAKDTYIRHPMHSQILIRFAIRFFVGVMIMGSLVAFRPIVSTLLYHDIEFLRAEAILDMALHMLVVIIGWLFVLHFYVVMFRLFAFRTRVFGEIIH